MLYMHQYSNMTVHAPAKSSVHGYSTVRNLTLTVFESVLSLVLWLLVTYLQPLPVSANTE